MKTTVKDIAKSGILNPERCIPFYSVNGNFLTGFDGKELRAEKTRKENEKALAVILNCEVTGIYQNDYQVGFILNITKEDYKKEATSLVELLIELTTEVCDKQTSFDELWQDTTDKMMKLPESDELIQVAKKELNVPEEYDVADWTITERWDDIEYAVKEVWDDVKGMVEHMDENQQEEYYKHCHDWDYDEDNEYR